MRTLAWLALAPVLVTAGCQKSETESAPAPPASAPADAGAAIETPTIELAAVTDQQMEVGCAMCIYDMPGVDGCKTAVVVAGQPVLVVGTGEDAHAHGLCGESKQALVSGDVKDGRLHTSKLEIQ